MPMIVGYDISTAQQVEDRGHSFLQGDEVRPLEQILAQHGATHVRLRLWVDPPYPYSDLPHVLAMARRVRDAGLKLLLDFHYSDFWADPAKQPTPKAWQHLDLVALADTVRGYTESVLATLREKGTPADMVQIGNEVTNGMLWPLGQIYLNGEERWDEFAMLLRAGIDGARAVAPAADQQIMVHIDRGADNAGSRRFLDHILDRGVKFDQIGLSFYPWWHGTLAQVRDNLHDLAGRYHKDLVLVETAYPWTLDNHDSAPNIVGPSTELPPEYPPTIEGQRAFLKQLLAIVRETPGGHGLGVMYWEPAWLPGVAWEPDEGNGWDNLTLFGPDGRALPSLDWPAAEV